MNHNGYLGFSSDTDDYDGCWLHYHAGEFQVRINLDKSNEILHLQVQDLALIAGDWSGPTAEFFKDGVIFMREKMVSHSEVEAIQEAVIKKCEQEGISIAIPHMEELYENKYDNHDLEPVLVDINEELKCYFAKHPNKLYDLSPRKFEELVADILSDFGFDVTLTSATRDGGKDILAYMKNQICSFLMLVECKKWLPSKRVGIEVVQRLYGVQQINNANKSMIVITSFFTGPAKEERNRYEYMMCLKDYDDIKTWLKPYKEANEQMGGDEGSGLDI
jgi:hypothetical protein